MNNQSTGSKEKKRNMKWLVEEYVICSIEREMDCYYWRQGQQDLMKIVLDDKREMYLDFNSRLNRLEKACLYVGVERFHLTAGVICKTILKEKKSKMDCMITEQVIDWLHFCIQNKVPFRWKSNCALMDFASREDELRKLVLKFNSKGQLEESKYLADSMVYECQLDENLKALIKDLVSAKKAS